MYLRKSDGPRVVTLPDGTVLSRDDLPGAETRRWVASRKAVVAKAVLYGLIKRTDALQRYDLSDEELSDWIRAVERHGLSGLKVTRIDVLRGSR
ncbi:DUF1153 domain-containing protein [Meridianimarinicoccus roseus]|jgi:hypothetical protein|uniref:DUF1153 domain-containing protein n=1 Tax=Meridianimarinicoccus roseus TaxID=2072018 RepID=A0A2V2LCT3_9RHOB|nr:DUF1153 domain-containing protein [Meridianimarinicoccus roseus]PWR01571.1 DUF1153 domain-containing protein [Meridianimarinicoccus roseus]